MLVSRSNPWAVSTRTVVLAAVFGAMVIALQVVGLGSIPVPNISGAMTTLLIPVILGAVIGGPIVGMFAGLVMGVIYLVLPATASFGFLTLVPSRLVMALVAWAVFRAVGRTNTALGSAVAGAVGALTNTVVTVGIAIALGQVPLAVIPTLVPQALVELIGSAVIVAVIVAAVDAARRR